MQIFGKTLMKEKRKELKNSQQKEIIAEVVGTLNQSHPSFYYLSTIEIAGEVRKYIDQSGNLSRDKFDLVKGLSRRDIQILLSLHSS